jgi:hypothetical protein
MMKTRHSLLAAALVAAGSLGAAQAAEISLYSHPGFTGKRLTAQGPLSNVTQAGFNDQTSSIVVHSGRWEVCTHADFQGYCAVLMPGEYARLDAQFNDRISSVRDVTGRGERVGGWQGHGDGPALELFDQRGLRGERLAVDRNVRNLMRFNFNDRTSSVLVREGTWQVCAAANFAGTCRTLGPGSYPSFGHQLSDKISSVRRIDGQHAYDRRGRGRDFEQALVELFMQPGFGGPRYTASQDVANLDGTAFNDRVESMTVNEGRWELCSDAGYRGRCIVVGPGRYEHLGDMSQRLSSIRRVG